MTTMNVATDLSPAQMGAIRQAVDIPIDLYIEVPDNFGGFVRYYEMPSIIPWRRRSISNSACAIRPTSIPRESTWKTLPPKWAASECAANELRSIC